MFQMFLKLNISHTCFIAVLRSSLNNQDTVTKLQLADIFGEETIIFNALSRNETTK